jgi:hypothetical protein
MAGELWCPLRAVPDRNVCILKETSVIVADPLHQLRAQNLSMRVLSTASYSLQVTEGHI